MDRYRAVNPNGLTAFFCPVFRRGGHRNVFSSLWQQELMACFGEHVLAVICDSFRLVSRCEWVAAARRHDASADMRKRPVLRARAPVKGTICADDGHAAEARWWAFAGNVWRVQQQVRMAPHDSA